MTAVAPRSSGRPADRETIMPLYFFHLSFGDRLLSGKWLFDGHDGQQVAELTPHFVQYFLGGPPAPWLHYGTQQLIVTHGEIAVYDARTGRALPVRDARHYG